MIHKPGTRVRFTAGPLGAVKSRDGDSGRIDEIRFVTDVYASEGDVGVYVGPHPDPHLANAWAMIEIERAFGETFYVPAHDGQYEVIGQ